MWTFSNKLCCPSCKLPTICNILQKRCKKYLDQFSIFLSCVVCGTIILKILPLYSQTHKNIPCIALFTTERNLWKLLLAKKRGETGVLWGCCRISSITYRARLKLLIGNCALQYFSHCPKIFLSELLNISLITLKYFSYCVEIFYSLLCTISLFVLDYFSHCFRICLSLL